MVYDVSNFMIQWNFLLIKSPATKLVISLQMMMPERLVIDSSERESMAKMDNLENSHNMNHGNNSLHTSMTSGI